MTLPLDPGAHDARADAILRAAELGDWDALAQALVRPLGEAAAAGVVSGFAQVPGADDDEAFHLANQDAIHYAAERAAELVGRRRAGDGFSLTDSPEPWAITETTRDGLRAMVTQALEEGWSPQELSQAVQESWLFGATRAQVIARTELALAETAGHLAAWTRSGVVSGKKSLLSDGHDKDDECDTNAQVGILPLSQAFPSGHQGPPYHPNCTCAVVPVVRE